MKKLFTTLIICAFTVAALATGNVLRLVPNAGTAQDIPMTSLSKVVFTGDSIIMVYAGSEEQTPYYKYDYTAMLFSNNEPSDEAVIEVAIPKEAFKFLKNGQLYIRLGDKIFDSTGRCVQ